MYKNNEYDILVLESNLTKFAGYLEEKNNLKYPKKPNQLARGMTGIIMMDHLVSS